MIRDEDKSVVVKLRMRAADVFDIKSRGYKVGSFINRACWEFKWSIDHDKVDPVKLHELRSRGKSKRAGEVTEMVQVRLKRVYYEMMEMEGFNKTRFIEEAVRRMKFELEYGSVGIITDMKMRGMLTAYSKGKVSPKGTHT